MTIQEKFGNKIKELRFAKNISQEQAALNCGLDRTHYQKIEAGKKNLTLSTIEKIAKGFEVQILELFEF